MYFPILQRAFLPLAIVAFASVLALPQSTELNDQERLAAKAMLRQIVEIVKDKYYDKSLKGVDIDALAKKAERQIDLAAQDILVYSAFADVLGSLNDSHTFFIPPTPDYHYHHGWAMQMIGEECVVVRVEKDSDAATKGLRPGDRVRTLQGVAVSRGNFADLVYFFYVLNPTRELTIESERPDKTKRTLTLTSELRKSSFFGTVVTQPDFRIVRDRLARARQMSNLRIYEFRDKLVFWRLRSFELSPYEIDSLGGRIRKAESLILDLRGNAGGYTDSLNRLIGHFFDRKVNIGTRLLRKGPKTETVLPRGGKAYGGRIVILIDSGSASAAEHFARLMQIEKRAVVIGDRSAGALETSEIFERSVNPTYQSFEISVSVEGVLLPDGSKIEGVGVTPDRLLLPSAEDIAAGRDTVLSAAAASLGFTLRPERAHAMVEEYQEEYERLIALPKVK